MSKSAKSDAEALLAHAGWVRALAARLARDQAEAEDLSQDTLAAALAHPPREAGPLRPWLGRVLGNLLRSRRRAERRRSDREALAAGWAAAERSRAEAGPPAGEGAAGLLEQLERQRVLADLVATLDEPYRSAILARYYRGETAAQIARRTGQPAGSVRSQLARGRQLLRERLVRREGGDAARALLLAASRGPDLVGWTSTTLAFTKGVLAVKTTTKLAAAGIAAAALLGAFVGLDALSERAEPQAQADPPASPASLAAVPDPGAALIAAQGDGASAARAMLDVPVEQTLVAEPAAVPAEPESRAGITARIVGSQGQPLAGAVLRYVEERRPDHHTSSEPAGPDGRVTLELAPAALPYWGGAPLPATYVVHAAQHGAHFFLASARLGELTDLGEIPLGPGGRVRGRVLSADGQPVAGAEVVLADVHLPGDLRSARLGGPDRGLGLPASVCDADGVFRVPHVAAGPARVWARRGGGGWSFGDPLEVLPGGETAGVELRLEDGASPERSTRIRGRVLDPSGGPVAGASVSYTARDPHYSGEPVSTEADGSFVIHPQVQSAHLLVAKDAENAWRASSRDGVLPGEEVELRLGQAVWMDVRLVDERGEPADATLNLELMGLHSWSMTQREQRGIGHFGLVIPESRFRLSAHSSWFHSETSESFEPASAPTELTLTLRRKPLITGRVLAGGRPVAGADVLACTWFDDHAIRTEGFQMHYDMHMASGGVQTDAEGRFSLPARDSRRRAVVVARAEGWALAEWGPFAATAEGLGNIEIELTRGGSIAGRLRRDGGRDPAGQLVLATRGDGEVMRTRTDPDGAYSFEQLTPGPWRVEHRRREVDKVWTMLQSDELEEVEWNAHVREGEVTRLDLRDAGEVLLRGRLTVDGAGAEGWSATVEHRDTFDGEHPARAALLDAGGRFELRCEPGVYRFELHSPAGQAAEGAGRAITTIAEELVLEDPEHPWELALELATIEGRLAGRRALRHELGAGERSVETSFETDADGAFRCRVPAGVGLLHERGYDARRLTNWRALRRLELRPGEVLTLELD